MSRFEIKNDQLAIFELQLINARLEQQNLTLNSFSRKSVIENSNTTSDNIHNGIRSDGFDLRLTISECNYMPRYIVHFLHILRLQR